MELALKKVNKSFGKTRILHNFSMTLLPGVYGLLGPNGAGKTTLMNILSNTSLPTSGEVLWNGKSIKKCGDRYRSEMGYLPQDVGLYPDFTGRDFLRYIATLKDIKNKEIEKRIEQIGKIVNLTDVLDRKCGKYSGGMKRRLGVAQALLNHPKVLILDEPTEGLDPMERIRFRNMISQISSNRIVIISTHIVSDIDRIAKGVILINKGRIIENTSMEKLVHSMKGKVWEVNVMENELSEFEHKFKVVNIQQKEQGVSIRIIDENSPCVKAVSAVPCLEDVYMYYFKNTIKGSEEH